MARPRAVFAQGEQAAISGEVAGNDGTVAVRLRMFQAKLFAYSV